MKQIPEDGYNLGFATDRISIHRYNQQGYLLSDGNGQLYRIIGANLMNSLAPAEQDYILAIASNSTWVCFCSNTKMYIVPNAKDLDPTELRTILEIQNKEFITAMDFLNDT